MASALGSKQCCGPGPFLLAADVMRLRRTITYAHLTALQPRGIAQFLPVHGAGEVNIRGWGRDAPKVTCKSVAKSGKDPTLAPAVPHCFPSPLAIPCATLGALMQLDEQAGDGVKPTKEIQKLTKKGYGSQGDAAEPAAHAGKARDGGNLNSLSHAWTMLEPRTVQKDRGKQVCSSRLRATK